MPSIAATSHRRTSRVPDGPPLIDAAYGRVYARNLDIHHRIGRLAGATFNERTGAWELSLTMPTLRAIRRAVGWTPAEFMAHATRNVAVWAREAVLADQRVAAVHARIDAGERVAFPWRDFAQSPPRRPFAHQEVMASFAYWLDGVAFICGMGTGKTRAAAEALAAKMHAGELRFAVVLCPKRVMGTWAREIDTWTRGSLRPVILEGATSERARAIRELQETGTVLILNYEALRYPGMMGALIGLLQRAPTALIPDEMHRIRNPSAQQSKLTLKLASLAAWRVGLTGTPVIQGAHDVWSQWYAVDLGQAFGANFVQFRREWFDVNPWTYEVQPRAGAEHAIGERMRARGLRYRKEDCLDLPPKLYETQEVEPTDEQARAYRQMRDELVATLNDPENPATAANQLTAIMRLAQITSGFLPMEDGRVHVFAPNPKLLLLDELLDELLLDNSVIVWCWYRHDVATLRARYARHHPSIIQGGQTSADSEAQMARFQNRQTRLLIANQASGGLGISLTAASVAIYYSQNFSLEHRLQSEDRCHRAGSEIHNRVTYIDLMMRGTVDEVIQQALARKLSVAEMVVDLRRHLGL